MKILVYGIGAMGSIYASLMADAGNNVFVVDKWEEHINKIQPFFLFKLLSKRAAKEKGQAIASHAPAIFA